MRDKIHYYIIRGGQKVRITKQEADEIRKFNESLTFDRWSEIKFVFEVKADDHDEAKRIAGTRKKVKCPRCGNALAPSDVEGYAFVCYECDENFYKIEIK